MKNKEIKYECLNVAGEVVFVGIGPDVLQYCHNNQNQVKDVREEGTYRKYPMEFWCALARITQKAVKAHEDKKIKKGEKKHGRRKD